MSVSELRQPTNSPGWWLRGKSSGQKIRINTSAPMTPVPLLQIRNSPFSVAVHAPRCCRLENSAQEVQLVRPANAASVGGCGVGTNLVGGLPGNNSLDWEAEKKEED